jgi:hypothetical protein
VLNKAKIPMQEYLRACEVDVVDCVREIGKGMKAENRKAFLHQESGEVQISEPFVDAAAHETRRKHNELALALHGVTTKRTNIQVNVDVMAQEAQSEAFKDMKAGEYEVEK